MSDPCERVLELLPELVRGDPLPADLAEHLAGCPACGALRGGAGALQRGLAAWAPPPPPDDLIERTLARLALAGAAEPPAAPAPAPAPAGAVLPFPGPRRRTSIELLTASPLDETPAAPPPRGRLLLRLVVQAAAAAVMFAASLAFLSVYYPAVVQAKDEKELAACQEHLRVLREALLRWEAEHPGSRPETGPQLRQALLEGGYLDEAALRCPGRRAREHGARGYLPSLRPSNAGDAPLWWDTFDNHAGVFNVIYRSGRLEQVRVEALDVWLMRHLGPGERE